MLCLEACLHKFPRKRMEKAAASPSPRKSPLAIWLVALATLLPWKSSFCKHASKQHDFKERSIMPNILTILLRLTSCQPSWMARLKRTHTSLRVSMGPIETEKVGCQDLALSMIVWCLSSPVPAELDWKRNNPSLSVLF